MKYTKYRRLTGIEFFILGCLTATIFWIAVAHADDTDPAPSIDGPCDTYIGAVLASTTAEYSAIAIDAMNKCIALNSDKIPVKLIYEEPDSQK